MLIKVNPDVLFFCPHIPLTAATLLTELMGAILNESVNGFLHRKHLHHLLLPHLQTMKLSSSAANVAYGFEIMQQRCKVEEEEESSFPPSLPSF